MKKIYILTFALLLSKFAFAQLYNNGAALKLNTGAIVHVNNVITNTSTGTITNNGLISLTGSLINDAVISASNTGTLAFVGDSRQNVQGAASFLAKDVNFNNPAGVTILKSLKIDGVSKFQNGLVFATNTAEPLVYTSNGTVSSTNAPADAKHVDGFVVKEGTGAFTYPLGDGTRYQKVETNLTDNATGLKAKYYSNNAGVAPLVGALLFYNPLEYWDLTSNSTAIGTVTIHWDDYQNQGINNLADLVVAHKTGGNWKDEFGAPILGTTSLGSVTSTAVSTWSPFTLGSTSVSSPLPVNLISFRGASNDNINKLEWQVSSEMNNKGFDIERSADGKHFEKIGFVQGRGTSSKKQRYNFEDNTSLKATAYYRLKQLDFDGKHHYSNIIVIDRRNNAEVFAFPNPSKGVFTIKGIEDLEAQDIKIFDVLGNTMNVQFDAQNQIDLTSYPEGIYLLQVSKLGKSIRLIKK